MVDHAALEDTWLTAKFVLDRRFIDDGLDGKDRP
jgi:hypothetical protein